MERNDATGLRFALSAEAEPCDDDRPCAYCNPDEMVAEREAVAENSLDQFEEGEDAYPETTVLTFQYENDDREFQGRVVSSREVMGGGSFKYKVELLDSPNTYRWLNSAAIIDAEIPGDAGVVKADYVLTMGHKDGAGVEVPVCDSCLVDCPVEVRGESTQSEMQYRYYGDGEVVQKYKERVDGTVHHKTAEVDV